MGLALQASDVAGRWRWRWLLVDEDTGAPLADHQVAIDPASAEAQAFTGLDRFLRWQADPDRRVQSEAELLERIGGWIGETVLGPSIGRAIVAAAPVTVRVQVPEQADFLLFAPLELAHVDGTPLARRGDVSLVFDLGAAGRAKPAMAERLRMVAVFSLPTDSTALALRRERYELTRLVRRLAARQRRAIELEVLQYGVTRQMLTERMTADGGPEVLHLSGHGGTGLVLLETPDGGADPVPASDLIALLRPGRSRVRLAVLSACQSAAATMAETLRWLHLDDAADQAQAVADADTPGDPEPLAGLAGQVARTLDCAVVAMRYPVADDFAIALTDTLYEGLFALGLPVDAALRRALPAAAGDQPSASRPAISIATPTLFGTRAAGLALTPPRGRPQLDPAEARMSDFPDEPIRFVGRASTMARASRALAPAAEQTGVLLYGMAGAGKTACALELAYRHQNSFSLPVWWQAPLRHDEFAGALTSFALALERQLGEYGFTMVDQIATVERLRGFLPRLTQLLEDAGLLLVLDNLETLLTPTGDWRDPRWEALITALTTHSGESRVVLTSRIRPAGLGTGMRVDAVHALSRDESALLARELPHLRQLLHADAGPTRAGTDVVDHDRAQVRTVLRLVQGHPKLLELADAAAEDPEALAVHLAAAEAATDGTALSAFFHTGESALDADGFLTALDTWTASVTGTLPPASRLLLQVLAGIEDGDRWEQVLRDNWSDIWTRVGQDGEAPDLADTLAPLVAAALVHPEGGELSRYRLHPGVASAIQTNTPEPVRAAVDRELAAFWRVVMRMSMERKEGEHSQTVVHAGLAAAPYLLRLGEWDSAGGLLDDVLRRDRTQAVALAAIAHLLRVADATGRVIHRAILSRAMLRVDPVAGERLMREALAAAEAESDYRLATSVVGDLVDLLRGAGRLREALQLADDKADYTRRAGVGPWSQLSDRGVRLQILYVLGRRDEVLTDAYKMLDEMRELPTEPGDDEISTPWNVYEATLSVAANTAVSLERWEEALSLVDASVTSKQQRGAAAHEIATIRYVGCTALIRLNRFDEAERSLMEVQQAYEDANDVQRLSRVLTVRAVLAKERGHLRDAAALERTALRLSYAYAGPADVAASHHNLANYLESESADPHEHRAHRVASALIYEVAGRPHELDTAMLLLARELRSAPEGRLPTTLAALAAALPGLEVAALVTALAGSTEAVEEALTGLIERARAADDDPEMRRQLEQWEPVIEAVVAGALGNQEAAEAVGVVLDGLADNPDWRYLSAALRRVLAGEKGPALLDGLDYVDTEIMRVTLANLDAPTTPAPAPEEIHD